MSLHKLDLLEVPDTAHLFTPLRHELLALLRALGADKWDAPTVAGAWRVRDVAAHLLDGELRTLAAHRDGHALADGGSVQGYADVVGLVQRLNGEGVTAGRHWSARLLTDLLEVTGAWMSDFVATLDPDAPALFAVAWAGEAESTNRFDTAREYTERWHHQMQIRLAAGDLGQPSVLLAERWARPLLDTAVRVLPHAFRSTTVADGEAIELTVSSESRDDGVGSRRRLSGFDSPWRRVWSLLRENGTWRLYAGAVGTAAARVRGDPDAWWRLFFNAVPSEEASRAFEVEGDHTLVSPLWRARSVMV